jgi:hypothetical protein
MLRLVHRALRTALIVGLVCVACGAGGIITSAPSPAAAERDLLLTIQARRALLRDAELGPLNLGVQIRNGVATLWGPVPSPSLSFKAEVCLRALLELTEVRNDLVVGEGAPGRQPGVPPTPAFLPPPAPPALPSLPANPVLAPLAPLVRPRTVTEPVSPPEESDPLPQRLPRSK